MKYINICMSKGDLSISKLKRFLTDELIIQANKKGYVPNIDDIEVDEVDKDGNIVDKGINLGMNAPVRYVGKKKAPLIKHE